MKYINAQEAFESIYTQILSSGENRSNGNANWKSLYNVGFEILNPTDNLIETDWRKWSKDYADLEWSWYLSGNRNADEIARHAKIWKSCQDDMGNVNSNYGWQWRRNNQIDYVINELKSNRDTRRAAITIYDAKEWETYTKDTPCTYAIWFNIIGDKLNMSVMMRSNDLVYGFCNDQYCFSNIQKMIAKELLLDIGTYYHFVNDIHIYERHWSMKK